MFRGNIDESDSLLLRHLDPYDWDFVVKANEWSYWHSLMTWSLERVLVSVYACVFVRFCWSFDISNWMRERLTMYYSTRERVRAVCMVIVIDRAERIGWKVECSTGKQALVLLLFWLRFSQRLVELSYGSVAWVRSVEHNTNLTVWTISSECVLVWSMDEMRFEYLKIEFSLFQWYLMEHIFKKFDQIAKNLFFFAS